MQTTVTVTLNGVDMEVTGDYEPMIPARTLARQSCATPRKAASSTLDRSR